MPDKEEYQSCCGQLNRKEIVMLMRGFYQDEVRSKHGDLIFKGGWSCNTIVESAWPLVAGLLKNDPDLSGILFWAVGEGSDGWDTAQPAASPGMRPS